MGNMSPEDYAIAMKLCAKDDDFKDLWDEHQILKTKLKELESRRFLTSEEEVEMKKLKRLKLTGKDKIAVKISEYKVAVSGPA
jgi:hypothetical protein